MFVCVYMAWLKVVWISATFLMSLPRVATVTKRQELFVDASTCRSQIGMKLCLLATNYVPGCLVHITIFPGLLGYN